jgi:hypothetical protein
MNVRLARSRHDDGVALRSAAASPSPAPEILPPLRGRAGVVAPMPCGGRRRTGAHSGYLDQSSILVRTGRARWSCLASTGGRAASGWIGRTLAENLSAMIPTDAVAVSWRTPGPWTTAWLWTSFD